MQAPHGPQCPIPYSQNENTNKDYRQPTRLSVASLSQGLYMRSPFSWLCPRPFIQQQQKKKRNQGEPIYISAALLLLIPRRFILYIPRLFFWVQGGHGHMYKGSVETYSPEVGPMPSTLRKPATFPEGTIQMKSKEQRTRLSWIWL